MDLLKKIVKRKLENSSDNESEESSDELQFNDDKVYIIDNDIYFRTDVTLKSVDKLVRIIKKCNNDIIKIKKMKTVHYLEPRSLKLHITSYGGDLMAGLMAADSIEGSSIPIDTIVEGYAASAATFMSIVGRKRYITPRSYMLIHQLRTCGFINKKYDEQNDDYENNKLLMEDIKKLYKKYTKLTKTQINDELKRDLWRDSKSCLEAGFVDDIMKF